MAFFTQDYLDFFKELAANNNKEWFDLNRKRYESSVKKPFAEFVQHLIGRFAKIDARFKDLPASSCIFRINRDIRFSKDKSPYKLMSSALVSHLGKKAGAMGGIYFELSPEAVRVYGGIYEPDKDTIYFVREGIANNAAEFSKLINDPAFMATYGEIRGERNKILPPEFKEPAESQPLIYNKQWYFMAEFPPEKALSADLDELLESCYLTNKPLEDFFNPYLQR